MSKETSKGLSLKEKETIKVLHADGESFNSIAVKLKRSPHTIKAFLTQPGVMGEVAELKVELSEIYESLSRRMLESITDLDITKINAYQRVIASSAATDKMRLLRDKSTANFSINTVVADLERRKEELLKQIEG